MEELGACQGDDRRRGVFGWGDATSSSSPLAVHGAVTEISRFCIGKDPLSPRRVWEEMFIALNLPVRGVILSAMAGIETACWDILGKSLDAPLHRLLGGKVNERIRAYANGWYKGPREPSFFAERAAEVAALGYRALKFDPFGANYRILDASRAAARAVTGACGARCGRTRHRHPDRNA